MSAYKDTEKNTWYVKFQYKDWTGKRKWVTKRGFATKREALKWEKSFMDRLSGSTDMSFKDFVTVYLEDRSPRLKDSTLDTKNNIIQTKLIPYFGEKKLREITSNDVLHWQNELLKYRDPVTGKAYKPSFLKTIHNQLSAIFNHAVRYYHLEENPACKAGNMGTDQGIKMKFWTQEQYKLFSFAIMDDLMAFYCFEVLYWSGIREGELLALTPKDVDLKNGIITISKTYHRAKKQDIITTPKTLKSNRVVPIPEFLQEELKEYMQSCYDMNDSDRLFPVSKHFLTRAIKKGAELAGLEPIRVHDLRHSHVSLLINLGFSAVAIAERTGHSSIEITYRYAHLFPSVQDDMIEKLNEANGEG